MDITSLPGFLILRIRDIKAKKFGVLELTSESILFKTIVGIGLGPGDLLISSLFIIYAYNA